MAKVNKSIMSIETLVEVTKNVRNAFPDVVVHMSKGEPAGALLTVHWDAEGKITETVLLIESEG